jgi:hypothetical protein
MPLLGGLQIPERFLVGGSLRGQQPLGRHVLEVRLFHLEHHALDRCIVRPVGRQERLSRGVDRPGAAAEVEQ